MVRSLPGLFQAVKRQSGKMLPILTPLRRYLQVPRHPIDPDVPGRSVVFLIPVTLAHLPIKTGGDVPLLGTPSSRQITQTGRIIALSISSWAG